MSQCNPYPIQTIGPSGTVLLYWLKLRELTCLEKNHVSKGGQNFLKKSDKSSCKEHSCEFGRNQNLLKKSDKGLCK